MDFEWRQMGHEALRTNSDKIIAVLILVHIINAGFEWIGFCFRREPAAAPAVFLSYHKQDKRGNVGIQSNKVIRHAAVSPTLHFSLCVRGYWYTKETEWLDQQNPTVTT